MASVTFWVNEWSLFILHIFFSCDDRHIEAFCNKMYCDEIG